MNSDSCHPARDISQKGHGCPSPEKEPHQVEQTPEVTQLVQDGARPTDSNQ